MKRILLPVFLLLLVESKAQTWELLTVPTIADIKSSSFISDSIGWIGIENDATSGKFFFTQDEGESWIEGTIDGATGGTTYLKFVTEETGFAVVNGEAFKTIDGGDAWMWLDMPGIAYYEPFFFDEYVGFISGYGEVYKTVDGGETWTVHITYSGPLGHLTFLDENNGVGSEYDGYVYSTSDGGVTWEQLDLPGLWTWTYSVCYDQDGNLQYTAVTDFLGQIGISFSSFYTEEFEDILLDCQYFDSLRAYAVGESGAVVFTGNDGANWGVENITEQTLNKVDGKNFVFVFGDEGTAFRCTTTCYILSEFDFVIDQQTVEFNSPGSDATEWHWDFGDGYTSTDQNPVHTYSIDGYYTVCHSAGNDSCKTVEVCQGIYFCSGSILSQTYSGSIDSSFSDDGFVFYQSNNPYYEQFGSLAIQKDHKIVAVTRSSDASIVRYGPYGSIDSSFGSNGEVFLEEDLSPYVLKLSSDNQILVAGNHAGEVAVFRFNSDGEADLGFGVNGRVGVDPSPQTFIGSKIKSFDLQTDGKIIVFGTWSYFGFYSFVFRLNTDGSLDSTFGDQGIEILPFTEFSPDTPGNIEALPDGNILIASSYYDVTDQFFVARLLPDGSVDETFGSDGFVKTDFNSGDIAIPYDLALDAGQRIIQIGYAGNQFAMVRYTPDGEIDQTFGTDGFVKLLLGYEDIGFSMEVQNDGKIVTTGSVDYYGAPDKLLVARFDTLGQLDPSFGNQGFILMSGECESLSAYEVLLGNGKIYLCGYYGYYDSAMVIRLHNDACPILTAAFSAVASGITVQFEDQSYIASSWLWDFGDGTTSSDQNPSHAYPASGVYNVCLTVTDSCGSNTLCQVVSACEPLNTSYLYSGSGLNFQFANSVSNADSFFWDFDDGTTSLQQSPDHTFSSSGSYKVCLTESDSCTSETSCQVIIACGPLTTDFGYEISGIAVTFDDASVDAVSWNWDFGDGNTSASQNPVHVYSLEGVYEVCLMTDNGCTGDTLCQAITLCDPLNSDYFFQANELTYTFLNQITEADSFFWDFDDGITSTLQNPVHDFPSSGTYHVCLVEWDACIADTICEDLAVCGPLSTDFSYTASDLSVQFNDASVNTVSWNWDFGDGNSSMDQNPSQTYAIAGTYDVCLVTFNGCENDTFCKIITIVATMNESFSNQQASFNIYPNPFAASATIAYILNEPSQVTFELISMEGKVMKRIAGGNHSEGVTAVPEGRHEFQLNREGLAAGVYFLQFKSSSSTAIQKFTVE